MTYRKNNVFLTKEELAAKATRNESVSKRMSSSDETTLVRALSRSCFSPSPLMVYAFLAPFGNALPWFLAQA